jgi:SAM-dependent methyltransferase
LAAPARIEEAVMSTDAEQRGLEWQIGVWDRMSELYRHEIDPRFAAVVENVVRRGDLRPGQRVLDLGTGTGSVAVAAAGLVGPSGKVTAVDISPDMLTLARRRIAESRHTNIDLREGRAEQLPVDDRAVDVLLASLSLMYSIDRAAAAREMKRVLRPGGRVVAAVWAAPELCDIVLFQQTAGKFAPPPPVPGVGPGALADATAFLAQLAEVGIDARVETEELGFDFPDFELAWEVLAGVTAAQLSPERRQEAKDAVQAVMWPQGRGSRHFRNVTQFFVGRVAG